VIVNVFCNFLVFYVSAFYFILWAVVSAAYSALLSSSYFGRINADDDDDESCSQFCRRKEGCGGKDLQKRKVLSLE